jgi:hypothetical protein
MVRTRIYGFVATAPISPGTGPDSHTVQEPASAMRHRSWWLSETSPTRRALRNLPIRDESILSEDGVIALMALSSIVDLSWLSAGAGRVEPEHCDEDCSRLRVVPRAHGGHLLSARGAATRKPW